MGCSYAQCISKCIADSTDDVGCNNNAAVVKTGKTSHRLQQPSAQRRLQDVGTNNDHASVRRSTCCAQAQADSGSVEDESDKTGCWLEQVGFPSMTLDASSDA